MSSTSASALRLASTMVSVSPNCNCNCSSTMVMLMKKKKKTAMGPLLLVAMKSKSKIRCEVAINATVEESSSAETTKIGARVKVKEGVKVFHVPKVGELELTGLEGEIKQYVGLWKGKRISANLPYKVQFLTDIPDRGPVKFFAHLKEDEFDYL